MSDTLSPSDHVSGTATTTPTSTPDFLVSYVTDPSQPILLEPFLLSFDLPDSVPDVAEDDYYLIYEMSAEPRKWNQPIRGAQPAIVPGSARRRLLATGTPTPNSGTPTAPQAVPTSVPLGAVSGQDLVIDINLGDPTPTQDAGFAPAIDTEVGPYYNDPNVYGDYRPNVQDCYKFPNGEGVGETGIGLRPIKRGVVNKGRGIRNMAIQIDSAGAFGFCYTSKGAWNVLPQPIIIHGPKEMSFFKNDLTRTPYTLVGQDVPLADTFFGLTMMGFALHQDDQYSFSRTGTCPSSDVFVPTNITVVPRNAWARQTIFIQPPDMRLDRGGSYQICYHYKSPEVKLPRWISLGILPVINPLGDDDEDSPSPVVAGGADAGPGLSTGILGAAEWIGEQGTGVVVLLFAIPIVICLLILCGCIWWRRRKARETLDGVVWVDPMAGVPIAGMAGLHSRDDILWVDPAQGPEGVTLKQVDDFDFKDPLATMPMPPGFTDETFTFDAVTKPKKHEDDLWEFDPVEKTAGRRDPYRGIVDEEEDLPWTYYVPPDDLDDKLAPPPATPDSLFPGWDPVKKKKSVGAKTPASRMGSRPVSQASGRSTRQSMWFEMYNLRKTGSQVGQVRNARVVPEPTPRIHTQASGAVNPLAGRQPFVHRPAFLPGDTLTSGTGFTATGAQLATAIGLPEEQPPTSLADTAAVLAARRQAGAGAGIFNPTSSTAFVRDFQRKWLADRARAPRPPSAAEEAPAAGTDWVDTIEAPTQEDLMRMSFTASQRGTMPPMSPTSPMSYMQQMTMQGPGSPLARSGMNASPMGAALAALTVRRQQAQAALPAPVPTSLDWVSAIEEPPTPSPRPSQGSGPGTAATSRVQSAYSRAGTARLGTSDSRRRAAERRQRTTARQLQNAGQLSRTGSRAASSTTDRLRDTIDLDADLSQVQLEETVQTTTQQSMQESMHYAQRLQEMQQSIDMTGMGQSTANVDLLLQMPQLQQMQTQEVQQAPSVAPEQPPEASIPMTVMGETPTSTSSSRRKKQVIAVEKDVFPGPSASMMDSQLQMDDSLLESQGGDVHPSEVMEHLRRRPRPNPLYPNLRGTPDVPVDHTNRARPVESSTPPANPLNARPPRPESVSGNPLRGFSAERPSSQPMQPLEVSAPPQRSRDRPASQGTVASSRPTSQASQSNPLSQRPPRSVRQSPLVQSFAIEQDVNVPEPRAGTPGSRVSSRVSSHASERRSRVRRMPMVIEEEHPSESPAPAPGAAPAPAPAPSVSPAPSSSGFMDDDLDG